MDIIFSGFSLRRPILARLLAAVLAIIGWSAMAIDFHYVAARHHPVRIAHVIVTFLSFFTIISNLLVAIILTASALRPPERRSRLESLAAPAVVYILVTGVIYTLLLRQSHTTLMGWMDDAALHVVIPVGYPLFWLMMMPRRRLARRDAFVWLLLPLLFAVASIVRGEMTGECTYFFLNPHSLGYVRVVLAVALLSVMFLVFGFIVVAINQIAVKDKDAIP